MTSPVAQDRLAPPAREAHSNRIRVEAALVIVAGATAAVLTATVDAASIAPRLQGERIGERPGWMVGFGVAVFTAAIGAWILSDRHRPHHGVRALCLVAAAVNVSVAALQLVLTGAAWVLPFIHLVASVALLAIATQAGDAHRSRIERGASDRAPGAAEPPGRSGGSS